MTCRNILSAHRTLKHSPLLFIITGSGFQHFYFDLLPKIDHAYELLQKDPEIKVLYNDGAGSSFFYRTNIIDPKRLVRFMEGMVYSAKTLYLAFYHKYVFPSHGLPLLQS